MPNIMMLPMTFPRIQSQVSAPYVSNIESIFVYKPYVDNFSGGYKIAGKTIAGSVPYAAKVYVFPHTAPSLCIASTQTDSITGTFTFNYLAAGQYLVTALDFSGTYRMVNYSLIAAVPM
jgi:hypothetical protein